MPKGASSWPVVLSASAGCILFLLGGAHAQVAHEIDQSGPQRPDAVERGHVTATPAEKLLEKLPPELFPSGAKPAEKTPPQPSTNPGNDQPVRPIR